MHCFFTGVLRIPLGILNNIRGFGIFYSLGKNFTIFFLPSTWVFCIGLSWVRFFFAFEDKLK